jgi:hypothetical protein
MEQMTTTKKEQKFSFRRENQKYKGNKNQMEEQRKTTPEQNLVYRTNHDRKEGTTN